MSRPGPRYRALDRPAPSTAPLDEQLPPDHPARATRGLARALDFSDFEADVKAVEGHPGKPPLPPQLPSTLRLFALIDGACAARELARRCRRDPPTSGKVEREQGARPREGLPGPGYATSEAEALWQALAHNVSRLLSPGRLVGTAAGVRAEGR